VIHQIARATLNQLEFEVEMLLGRNSLRSPSSGKNSMMILKKSLLGFVRPSKDVWEEYIDQ